MKTRIADMFGVETPVCLGGRTGTGDEKLDTVPVGRSLRNTPRAARNAASEQVAAIRRDPARAFDDVRASLSGARGREQVLAGHDMDGGLRVSGQSRALIRDIPTCAGLIHSIMRQARASSARLAR